MGRQFVTACMFCLLCSTHTHCSSHHEKLRPQLGNVHGVDFLPDTGGGGGASPIDPLKFSSRKNFDHSPKRSVRDLSTPSSHVDYVKIIFDKYGNGENLSKDGFVKMLDALNLTLDTKSLGTSLLNNKENVSTTNDDTRCAISIPHISEKGLERRQYEELCPQILHHLLPELRSNCNKNVSSPSISSEVDYHKRQNTPRGEAPVSTIAVWFYATISVVLISLCGLLAVAVIPVMQNQIYQGLLQFLVALAVGTLVGDALLHLLPHAMMSAHADHAHSNHHHSYEDEDQHSTNLWKGLVAALSAIFFYFTEKGLSLVTDWRKRHQRKNKSMTKVRVMREDRPSNEDGRVGEKLCKHKYSSYPYCYGEIASNADCQTASGEPNNKNVEVNGPKSQEADGELQKEDTPNPEKQLLNTSDAQNEYTTIILREHETTHHGHSHTHGHVHSAPGSIKSVAWMVIMGDGIHNLTDGLAIGAAFAANIGGGLSTAVAVFCHELPHEIGDFAVLLRAGMSIKEAVVYNLISSILCLIGMSIGVLLGQNDDVKLWVFSSAAGMFLYIALVDMIPELTSVHSSEGSSACCQCLLQLLGLLSGVGIMLVIALYEHDLMTIFEHSL